METQEERLQRLDKSLSAKEDICSSEGVLTEFPPSLKLPYSTDGVGVVVCHKGNFTFSISHKTFTAYAGETLFIPGDTLFQVLDVSDNLEVYILVYRVEPLRDIMGNNVLSMNLYWQIISEPCYVWATGEEEEVVRYIRLLNSTLGSEDVYRKYEQKLLLLAFIHRLCSIYAGKLVTYHNAMGRQNEIFVRLIQLIEQYYTQERGVEFYADKLCLTPKYLSAMCKTICGYTVQELVFKSIIRKSISLLKNTQQSIQEISDYFNFPNPSYFGTFFKKQMGVSPRQYRKSLTP